MSVRSNGLLEIGSGTRIMAKSKTVKDDEQMLEINLPGTAAFGEGELGQIRNLLLGQHARETAERVARLESEVLATIADLRTEIEDRFAGVHGRITEEVETRNSVAADLTTRIDEEAQARRNAQIDLRTDLDRSATQIRDQIGSARDDLRTQIETVDADLRDQKVDRHALASLFEATAATLTGDAN